MLRKCALHEFNNCKENHIVELIRKVFCLNYKRQKRESKEERKKEFRIGC